MTVHRFGTATLVGRPNVGKSTLLNAIVGERLAIVTPKPQTTRNRIAGIRTLPDAQIVLLDTPGLPQAEGRLNRRLRQIAREARAEADVVLIVVDATAGLADLDQKLLQDVATTGEPAVVVLNKIDLVRKSRILPLIQDVTSIAPGVAIVPVSALDGTQVDELLREVTNLLPEARAQFDDAAYTTASVRFLAQELVREQVFLQTQKEVPYATAVVIESFTSRDDGLTEIHATILVGREAHKGILIGRRGERLGTIGRAAREHIEALTQSKVYLELFVRVEDDWLQRPDRLQALELG